MHYPDQGICRQIIFPLIRKEMAIAEPAPFYERERSGLERVDSIFALMKRDDYFGVLSKAAYLFCSVIDGHPFTNGNKRLAVALLSFFLLTNAYRVHAPSMELIRRELRKAFPNLRWQRVKSFRHPHEYFFYHLALIIADRTQKGHMTFQQEQQAVRELLVFITVKKAT